MSLTLQEFVAFDSLVGKSANIMATGVARLYLASPNLHKMLNLSKHPDSLLNHFRDLSPKEWTYTNLVGGLCLVLDRRKQTVFFKIYHLKKKTLQFEFEMYEDLKYLKLNDQFHAFEIEDCVAGFMFSDATVAKTFYSKVEALKPQKQGALEVSTPPPGFEDASGLPPPGLFAPSVGKSKLRAGKVKPPPGMTKARRRKSKKKMPPPLPPRGRSPETTELSKQAAKLEKRAEELAKLEKRLLAEKLELESMMAAERRAAKQLIGVDAIPMAEVVDSLERVGEIEEDEEEDSKDEDYFENEDSEQDEEVFKPLARKTTIGNHHFGMLLMSEDDDGGSFSDSPF